MKSKLIALFVLLALLLAPTSNAHAQSPGGDVVLVGQSYTVKSGETLNGSLVVIGGNVTVEKEAKVIKDVVVIGGNLTLAGNAGGNVVIIGGNSIVSSNANGDVVTIGGQTSLTKSAVVKGNVVTFGGQLTRADGAVIGGEVVNNAPPVKAPDAPTAPSAPVVPSLTNSNPFLDIAGEFGKAVGIALIAMILALFLQPQMERVSTTIVAQPFLSGSYGLLTIVVVPIALLIMIVTLILIPVAAIIALIIMPSIWVFGMIALGHELGERFTKAINQIWSPVLTTGFGTFLLVFGVGALSSIPSVECLGALISFLVSLVVIGGVVKTWLDARNASKPAAPAAVQVAEVVPPAA